MIRTSSERARVRERDALFMLTLRVHAYARARACTHERTHARTNAHTHARTHTRAHERTHTGGLHWPCARAFVADKLRANLPVEHLCRDSVRADDCFSKQRHRSRVPIDLLRTREGTRTNQECIQYHQPRQAGRQAGREGGRHVVAMNRTADANIHGHGSSCGCGTIHIHTVLSVRTPPPSPNPQHHRLGSHCIYAGPTTMYVDKQQQVRRAIRTHTKMHAMPLRARLPTLRNGRMAETRSSRSLAGFMRPGRERRLSITSH